MEDNINKQLEEIKQKITEKEIEEAYQRSEAFALVPILKLIYHTTGIDYSKDFKIKIPLSSNKAKNIPIGEIEINEIDSTSDNKNIIYKLYLDLVDSSYDLDNELNKNNLLSSGVLTLNNETNTKKKEQLIQIITFLTHSAKLLFDNLKNKYSEILEYNISLDNNTTIYLDYNKPLRLGINIKQIA